MFVDVYPQERINYLDGASNIGVSKRDMGGLCLGVVPDNHNVRLPFVVSIGDGDDYVRIGCRYDDFQTATCFSGAEKNHTIVAVW